VSFLLLFSPYTRLCLIVCFERTGTLLFEIVTGGVDLMVRALSRQGQKLPLFQVSTQLGGPDPEKSQLSINSPVLDFQEPAVSQTLGAVMLR
jgi:hypothetical protein